jgi:RimJ/RimL family protein N-acetyltransferase
MNPIPLKALDQDACENRLQEYIGNQVNKKGRIFWAVVLKPFDELIGMCAFLENGKSIDEIAYRFREAFWGQGFGTELVQGLLKYGFQKLHLERITADVWKENVNSEKILQKFMTFEKEFTNPNDGLPDRRYAVTRDDWLAQY